MTNTEIHPNVAAVIAALTEHSETVIQVVATHVIALGAKGEWSMEDNFNTTEGIARLAETIGLPAAGDQPDEALRFYGEAAQALGYDSDLSDLELEG